MQILTSNQWSELLSKLDSKTVNELSEEYGVNYSTIYKKMKLHKIPNRELNDETWDEILSQVSEVSPAELSRRYNVTPPAIHYQIKKRNIEYKPFVTRKHLFNEDFFENIDTESKAYWLGFIVADGSISKPTKHGKPKRLKICLSSVDKEHLQLFLNDIEANSIPIKQFMPHESTFGITEMCEIQVNSVKLCADLYEHGVIINKTGREVVPNIPKHLMRHFIRGFFDGDGSIHQSNKKNVVQFTGNYEMLNELSKVLIESINVSNVVAPIRYKTRNACLLAYSRKKDTSNFYNYIYDNSSIYLNRKYIKYKQLIS